ncbi:Putative zinc-finger [Streptomyces sp. WMMB 714]|uniref:zf-HC2 domain-containing protein n=1 Tax=Streptomyces sp. WMMB 714 TaxID=1286822 RepID=UPI0005F80892|nr:zf-HC2 domain-containing protein [Streptomyces sp. WMMB 714]SCK39762.1 Putative zinc-finger [Streptomyces sp. WMMB 714]
MLCSRARTALSARLDGEALPPGVTEQALQEHLAGCADCRAWEAGALRLQRAVDDEVAGSAESGRQDPRAAPSGGGSCNPGPTTGSSDRPAC